MEFPWLHALSTKGTEFYFCRDKLRTLNEMLFWPIPFLPSKVLFTDTSPTGPGGFIQGSALVCHKKLVRGRISKVFYLERTCCNNFALEAFDNLLAGQTVACSRLLIRTFLESSKLVVWLKNYKTSF